MNAAMALHAALSLRLDATEAYRLAHAYRDEERAKDAARIEDKACDADFTEHPQYCNGLRAAAELLASGEKGSSSPTAPAPTEPQAYDGELAMYRELVRTLRAVARPDDADMGQIRQLLHHHAADDAAAREQGKSSHQADATPDFFQPGRTYKEPGDVTDWRFRCDSVTTHPGTGERTALGWRHFRGAWEPYAYEEDSFEIHQIADAIATAQGDSK